MIVLELIYGICYEFVVVMNMMDKLFVDVVSSDFFWIMLISVLSLYFLLIITMFLFAYSKFDFACLR
jgi:hypothetical protein